MRINSNYGIGMYNMFNTMYQGNMALYNNKLNKSLFPNMQAQGQNSLAADSVKFVTNVKASSKALSGTLKDLSGPAFSNKTMVSSNTDVMTVNYTGNKPTGINPMKVKVDQIAAGQQNEGASLNAKDAFGGTTGINSFTIEKGGKTTQINVNVKAGDTNKDVQQKMADEINKSGVGLKATVVNDEKTNTSMLKIESTTTGSDPKNSFTITDKTGDLVARMDANNVAKEGQDAKYSINGGATRTSQSNTVNLGNGINATFNKASGEEVTISRGQDMGFAVKQVENLVKNYNDLYSEAAQRTGDLKSQSLATRMINTSKTYSASLSSIGIGFDNDGRMTIDAKKLNQVAESGKLEQFFTENSGKNYGFTNQLSRLADNVTRNTSNFVSGSQFGSSLSENFAYSSFGDLIQYNFLSVGSVLDFMM